MGRNFYDLYKDLRADKSFDFVDYKNGDQMPFEEDAPEIKIESSKNLILQNDQQINDEETATPQIPINTFPTQLIVNQNTIFKPSIQMNYLPQINNLFNQPYPFNNPLVANLMMNLNIMSQGLSNGATNVNNSNSNQPYFNFLNPNQINNNNSMNWELYLQKLYNDIWKQP